MFKSGRWNDWVSLIIANLLVGISYGWWQSKHTRHHANPNKEGADPDIALPAIAMTPAMATRHHNRLLRWLVAHQGWYFFPLLCSRGCLCTPTASNELSAGARSSAAGSRSPS